MANVLEKIVIDKARHIEELKLRYPQASLQPKVSDRSMYDALKQGPAGFIFECKKASPSKGLIRADFDPVAIAKVYKHYASAVSVLTDEKYFQGNIEFLPKVRAELHQPVLCKDFFIDEYQVDLAAHAGADAILLMLSVLDDERYTALAKHAAKYQLDILTEVSNQEELERALKLDAKIIGINNRNLRDLSTDLKATEQYAPQIPKDRVIISESGIYTNDDVRRLAPLVNGFLVGSSLMAEHNLDLACRKLVFGKVKVCGLKSLDDALAVQQAGGSYGGFIFYPKSPRYISQEQAQIISQSQLLNFVGVFVNAPVAEVAKTAATLALHAVQIHGDESSDYFERLKPLLPPNCQIWQATSPNQAPSSLVDVVLYDHKQTGNYGGNGVCLDWQSLKKKAVANSFLAGGLNPENIEQAIKCGFYQLDINSGVESSPGKKSPQKIAAAFNQIRKY
ncbi:bifunctional indole-3-glycerol-phosphate synthase TrpC/phosphoribosylanthranilate isomerase TrpF [Paraferrimonas sp. SM1919]|uniref:bifunctional indole-3-glycerol-phosphate synthase TrpC/phosphoribosylanthranilate isomerase TrpF n=1 Tax=Paraferrimonas sp. SM1919 TaxID=2662263 RepID=UPI0013D5A5D3|nr:bifunctional indole-3-glycerol-phosphate synthase TrpC/phosphoribosylanthranilate isomerase TrpF [Paraferrimonas sp. SM1919]